MRLAGTDGKFKHDTPLTQSLPERPAAVMIYSLAGYCRTLCLDFDAKTPNTAADVQANVRALTESLHAHGLRWFSDTSPSGGSHVYVPLEEPMPFDDARTLVEALALRYPTLDPSPHRSIASGCIRVPGSRHGKRMAPRHEDHLTLLNSLELAQDVLTRRNLLEPVVEFMLTLSPLMDKVRARRRVYDTPPPSEVHPTGSLALSARMYAIAHTGEIDAYSTPSEARFAVLINAATNGFTLSDVITRLEDGRWPGLNTFYAKYGSAHTRNRQLTREWRKALAIASKSDSVRRTTTSKISTQGGGRRRLAQLSVRQFVLAWLNAARTREMVWGQDRRSLMKRMVVRAMAEAAVKAGSVEIEFGVRSLSLAAGPEHTTVARALRELRSEGSPLVALRARGRGTRADRYELVIPDSSVELANTRSWKRGRIQALRPAFRVLGVPVALVYEALEQGARPLSAKDVGTVSHLSRSTVFDALAVLEGYGLAQRSPEGWLLGRASVEALGERLGAVTEFYARAKRYSKERHDWRTWLARRAADLGVYSPAMEDYPFEEYEPYDDAEMLVALFAAAP